MYIICICNGRNMHARVRLQDRVVRAEQDKGHEGALLQANVLHLGSSQRGA